MTRLKSASPYWTKKDGTRIRVCDMDDAHLGNSIRFVYRAAANRQAEVLMSPPCFQGEMAQMCANQEWDACLEEGDDPAYHFPVYDDLVEEAERRKAAGKWIGGSYEGGGA